MNFLVAVLPYLRCVPSSLTLYDGMGSPVESAKAEMGTEGHRAPSCKWTTASTAWTVPECRVPACSR